MSPIYVITATGVILGLVAAVAFAYRQTDDPIVINEPEPVKQ